MESKMKLKIETQILEEEKYRISEKWDRDVLGFAVVLGRQIRERQEVEGEKEKRCYDCLDRHIFSIVQKEKFNLYEGKKQVESWVLAKRKFKCHCLGAREKNMGSLVDLETFIAGSGNLTPDNFYCYRCCKPIMIPAFPQIKDFYWVTGWNYDLTTYNRLICHRCASRGVYFEPLLEHAEAVWEATTRWKLPENVALAEELAPQKSGGSRNETPDDRARRLEANKDIRPLIDLSKFRDRIKRLQGGGTNDE